MIFDSQSSLTGFKASLSTRILSAAVAGLCGSLALAVTSIASVDSPDNWSLNDRPESQIADQVLVVRAQEANAIESGLRLTMQQDRLPASLMDDATYQVGIKDQSSGVAFPSEIDKAMMVTFVIPPADDEGLSFPTDELDVEPILASLPRKRGQAQWQCLAEAVYFEARSESVVGQRAVAEVIMNRVKSRRFPNHVCAVVKQGADRRHKCQFSYNCDGQPEYINNARAYRLASEIAQIVISGDDDIRLTDGATHYHTTYVSPFWSRKLTKTVQIGEHIFYRESSRSARR